MLNQIRTYLINSGVTDTIYIDYLPADPDTCVLLRSYSSSPATDIQYNPFNVQVIARGMQYVTAKTLINNVYKLLHTHNSTNGIAGNTFITDIFAIQQPYFMGKDERGRFTFGNNSRGENKRIQRKRITLAIDKYLSRDHDFAISSTGLTGPWTTISGVSEWGFSIDSNSEDVSTFDK